MSPALHRIVLALWLAGLPALACADDAARPAALAGGNLLQVSLGLAAVLLAIAVTAWLVRRYLHVPAGMQGRLKILAGLSMGARERVVLLQVGDTQLLVGVAPGRIQTLHVLDRPVEPEPSAAPAPGFQAQLAAVLRRREGAS